MIDLEYHQFMLDIFPDYDQSYVPTWGSYWTGYSGGGWVVLFYKGSDLYILRYEFGPESDDDPTWDPRLITDDEAIDTMISWESND